MKRTFKKIPKEETSVIEFILQQIKTQYSRVELTSSAYNSLKREMSLQKVSCQNGTRTMSFIVALVPEVALKICFKEIYLIESVKTKEREYSFSGNTRRTLIIDF